MFKQFTLLVLFVLLFSIVGCVPTGTRALTPGSGTPMVQSATDVPAQTIATPTEGVTSVPPTATLLSATSTLLPATPTLSTGTPTPAASSWGANCTYRASFIADITVPDGTAMTPGASFSKTWRLRNDGTCTWGYAGSKLRRLVFVGGDQLGLSNAVELPFPELGQGGTVDISVPMVAPPTPGTYRSQWRLQVDGGPQIGVGPNGDTPLYAQIVVPGPATTTPVFSWRSFTSPKYGYVIGYPTDMTVVVENPGKVGDAVQVERVIFKLQSYGSFARSSAIGIEVAQHSYSKPAQCQIVTDVIRGIQGCRRSLPQSQGMSQELVWFRVPSSSLGYLYFSMQLIYDDLNYLRAFDHMLQTFKYTSLPITVPPPGRCTYKAGFVADVTVPDGTAIAPGARFTKTWRVRNDGTCTWGYAGSALHRLVFVGGDPLGAPISLELPFPELGQGGTVDISVPMVAPLTPGRYQSNWRFQVDNGPQVGVGPTGDTPFHAQIVVPGPATPTPVPPPAWKTYTSTKHHYVVSYPAYWTINVQTPAYSGEPEYLYLRPAPVGLPTVQILALKGSPPIAGFENCNRNLQIKGVFACSISLPRGQIPATQLLIFQKGDSHYHLAMEYDHQQQLAFFEEIVKSFQFTQ